MTHTMANRGFSRTAIHSLSILVLSLLLSVQASTAGNANPGIMPINSKPLGKSYGAWAVAWWQWALGIPEAQSPLLDSTGAYAGVNQAGPVWFLAGTFGNSAERNIVIPAGKSIFMPVHNWIFGAGVFDCDPTVPGVTCDIPTLREKAATATTSAETLEVTLDGVAIQNVRDYRAMSPDGFAVNFPEGAVFGIPSGQLYPHVADGYWLMLAPLSTGQHTIRVRVLNSGYGVDMNLVYHLTVQ